MNKKLAIVIPAYKASYLQDCLQSIAAQTCKDFLLYIGDDASPYDLESIVNSFRSQLSIQYKRFEENFGGIDLVSHWHRCIQMSHEPWIWLFSDDDSMDPTCVEAFYDALENTDGQHDIYHFNTIMIDKYGHDLLCSKPFPTEVSSAEYFKMLMQGGYFTFAVEYIFRRQAYFDSGGFVPMDLAWGSDSATWLRLAIDRKIYTIKSAYVKWRFSGDNISSIRSDTLIAERKILADLHFVQWALNFLDSNNMPDISTKIDKIYWIVRQLHEKKHLSTAKRKRLIQLYLQRVHLEENYPLALLIYHLYNVKEKMKFVLSKLKRRKIAI